MNLDNQTASYEDSFLNGGDAYGIYLFEQKSDDTRIVKDNYRLAWSEPLADGDTLDTIRDRFCDTKQRFDQQKGFHTEHKDVVLPEGFIGRGSGKGFGNGDIIALKQNGEIAAWIVNSLSFYRQRDFFQSPDNTPVLSQSALVYKQPPEYARENGELDQYRQSLKSNKACATAIEEAIKDSCYKPQYYDLKAAAEVMIANYGLERVDWVLANTIRKHNGDGRISSANMDWAKGFAIPENASGFFVNAHPQLINSFTDRVRETGREKPSLLQSLNEYEKKSKASIAGKGADFAISVPKKSSREEL